MSPRRPSREPAVPKKPKFVDATDPVISCKDKEVTPTQQGHANIGLGPTVEDSVPVVKGIVEDIVPEQLISQAALSRAKESLVAAQTCIEDAKQTIFAVDGIDDDSVPGTKARGLTPVDSPKEETETPELQGDADAGVSGDEKISLPKEVTPVLPEVAKLPPVSDSDEKRTKPGKSEPSPEDIPGVSGEGGRTVDGPEVGVETTGEPETEANGDGGPPASVGKAPDLGEDLVNGGSGTAAGNEENKDGPTIVVSPSTDQKTKPDSSRRKLRQYRPEIKKPRALPPEIRNEAADVKKFERPLTVRLLLKFGRKKVSPTLLLAKGSSNLSSLSAFNVQSGDTLEMVQYGDSWFVCPIEEYGTVLRDGLELEHRENDLVQVKWLLSGREIYVLGRPPASVAAAGWLQTPRVSTNQEHMVLCTSEVQEEVLGHIASAQAHQPVERSLEGARFDGWTLYENVKPESVVEANRDGTIFDVLKPNYPAKILFTGGIEFERSTWLKSDPPNIKIQTETEESKEQEQDVFIDGTFAECDEDGCYSVSGCFEVGAHIVQTAEITAKYRIHEPEWAPALKWEAHSFPFLPGRNKDTRVHFCGPLVWSSVENQETTAVIVPGNVPVLLGAVPGEIFVCSGSSTGRTGSAVGFPNFNPCWALPLSPLRASKRNDKIFCFPSESDSPPKTNLQNWEKQEQRNLKRWYRVILEARYRKLKLMSRGAAGITNWDKVCELAKKVRRKCR